MKDKWIKRYKIQSDNGNGEYTVAIDKDGNYGCSCPRWKFKREECKHILSIKGNERNYEEIKEDKEKLEEIWYRNMQLKGFIYYSFDSNDYYFRDGIKSIKSNKYIETYKSKSIKNGHIIMVKYTKEYYFNQFEIFINLCKKCNIRKHISKNPLYKRDWISSFYQSEYAYWIKKELLREILKKREFDLCQLLLFNNAGVMNPALGDDVWVLNKKLMHFKKSKYGKFINNN